MSHELVEILHHEGSKTGWFKPTWRYICTCGVKGRWQNLSRNASLIAHRRHAKKMNG